jgi:periplasmic divalent cation tolerance protein
MSDQAIVLVSCAHAQAEVIAKALVAEKLAACVSVLPGVTSIYRFKGNICQDEECLLFIKTERSLWSRLEIRIRELHSYEIPEILMIEIERGHEPYLSWLRDSVHSQIN